MDPIYEQSYRTWMIKLNWEIHPPMILFSSWEQARATLKKISWNKYNIDADSSTPCTSTVQKASTESKWLLMKEMWTVFHLFLPVSFSVRCIPLWFEWKAKYQKLWRGRLKPQTFLLFLFPNSSWRSVCLCVCVRTFTLKI